MSHTVGCNFCGEQGRTIVSRRKAVICKECVQNAVAAITRRTDTNDMAVIPGNDVR